MTPLEQIIQKLKAARESKGLTVEQICERTRVPLHHLEGLEEGRFDDLPEPVYVSGFIKLYANQLGLNGQLLANEYREWAESENPRAGGNKKRIKSAPDVPIIVSDDYFQRNKIETSPPTFKTIYFNIIMIVLVLGLVSYLGMTQFNNYSNQLEGNSVYTSQNAGSRGTVTGTTETQTGGAASGTAAGSAAPSRDQLVLSADKHVWVEVKSAATGDNLYIGFLEPGSNKIFDTPEQGLRVRAADGALVSVSYQGKTAALGIAGQETEKVFAPQTAAGLPSTPTAAVHANSPPVVSTSSTGTSAAGSSSLSSSTSNNVKSSAVAAVAAPAVRRQHSTDTTATPPSDGQPYKYGEGRLDAE